MEGTPSSRPGLAGWPSPPTHPMLAWLLFAVDTGGLHWFLLAIVGHGSHGVLRGRSS